LAHDSHRLYVGLVHQYNVLQVSSARLAREMTCDPAVGRARNAALICMVRRVSLQIREAQAGN
jgi:hypothetical protein